MIIFSHDAAGEEAEMAYWARRQELLLLAMENEEESGSDRVALRVFADNSPSYLRGRAFVRYNNSQWTTDHVKDFPLEDKKIGLRLKDGHLEFHAPR